MSGKISDLSSLQPENLHVPLANVLDALQAAGEITRLRILLRMTRRVVRLAVRLPARRPVLLAPLLIVNLLSSQSIIYVSLSQSYH